MKICCLIYLANTLLKYMTLVVFDIIIITAPTLCSFNIHDGLYNLNHSETVIGQPGMMQSPISCVFPRPFNQ